MHGEKLENVCEESYTKLENAFFVKQLNCFQISLYQ